MVRVRCKCVSVVGSAGVAVKQERKIGLGNRRAWGRIDPLKEERETWDLNVEECVVMILVEGRLLLR